VRNAAISVAALEATALAGDTDDLIGTESSISRAEELFWFAFPIVLVLLVSVACAVNWLVVG
jgi:hypothetical protein